MLFYHIGRAILNVIRHGFYALLLLGVFFAFVQILPLLGFYQVVKTQFHYPSNSTSNDFSKNIQMNSSGYDMSLAVWTEYFLVLVALMWLNEYFRLKIYSKLYFELLDAMNYTLALFSLLIIALRVSQLEFSLDWKKKYWIDPTFFYLLIVGYVMYYCLNFELYIQKSKVLGVLTTIFVTTFSVFGNPSITIGERLKTTFMILLFLPLIAWILRRFWWLTILVVKTLGHALRRVFTCNCDFCMNPSLWIAIIADAIGNILFAVLVLAYYFCQTPLYILGFPVLYALPSRYLLHSLFIIGLHVYHMKRLGRSNYEAFKTAYYVVPTAFFGLFSVMPRVDSKSVKNDVLSCLSDQISSVEVYAQNWEFGHFQLILSTNEQRRKFVLHATLPSTIEFKRDSGESFDDACVIEEFPPINVKTVDQISNWIDSYFITNKCTSRLQFILDAKDKLFGNAI
jgi:hypothetical protein